MGAIEDRAAAEMPETIHGLRKSALFGTTFVANKVDFVKFRLFSTVVSASSEASVYNPLVLEYAGKLTALQLINAGMDFWGSAPMTESLTGVNETVSFTDRAKNLQELAKRLTAEIAELAADVGEDVLIRRRGGAKVSPGGADLTPNPQDFDPLPGERIFPLPWSNWSA
jgi:hypothetical protein